MTTKCPSVNEIMDNGDFTALQDLQIRVEFDGVNNPFIVSYEGRLNSWHCICPSGYRAWADTVIAAVQNRVQNNKRERLENERNNK